MIEMFLFILLIICIIVESIGICIDIKRYREKCFKNTYVKKPDLNGR